MPRHHNTISSRWRRRSVNEDRSIVRWERTDLDILIENESLSCPVSDYNAVHKWRDWEAMVHYRVLSVRLTWWLRLGWLTSMVNYTFGFLSRRSKDPLLITPNISKRQVCRSSRRACMTRLVKRSADLEFRISTSTKKKKAFSWNDFPKASRKEFSPCITHELRTSLPQNMTWASKRGTST